MNVQLFQGELVHLIAPEPQLAAGLHSRWMRDSEFVRLLDTDPARLFSVDKNKEWFEKNLVEEQKDDELFLLIRTLEEDRTIGLIGLDGIRWTHGDAWIGIGLGEREYWGKGYGTDAMRILLRDAWIGIGLGEREYWGKGYGTDAMRILLRYAFEELNLHRLSLCVFEYNPRAIHSYEKVGFIIEGSARKFLNRDGQRYDMLFMGILREEWERR
ncbi:GNAT family N-acetyltransferase [Chloroflexota bacterium]